MYVFMHIQTKMNESVCRYVCRKICLSLYVSIYAYMYMTSYYTSVVSVNDWGSTLSPFLFKSQANSIPTYRKWGHTMSPSPLFVSIPLPAWTITYQPLSLVPYPSLSQPPLLFKFQRNLLPIYGEEVPKQRQPNQCVSTLCPQKKKSLQ